MRVISANEGHDDLAELIEEISRKRGGVGEGRAVGVALRKRSYRKVLKDLPPDGGDLLRGEGRRVAAGIVEGLADDAKTPMGDGGGHVGGKTFQDKAPTLRGEANVLAVVEGLLA